jgi:hypothetical protein
VSSQHGAVSQRGSVGGIRQGSNFRTSHTPSSPQLPQLPQQQQGRQSLRFAPTHTQHRLSSAAREELAGRETQTPYAEDESAIDEREDADALNEIIMAIDMKERGTVGCAYYVARDEKLFLIEDIKLAEMDIVDTLKMHAAPTVILISTKSSEELEEHLMKEAKEAARSNDPSRELRSSQLQNILIATRLTRSRCHLWQVRARLQTLGRILLRSRTIKTRQSQSPCRQS